MKIKRYLLLLCVMGVFSPLFALEQVTLQLRWLHQFQFAGYYIAKEKGYYRDVGLDVNIVEANAQHPHPVEEVTKGNAQYGIGNSGLINERLHGKPIVVLASIFQTSPNVWIVRKDSHINTIVDMVDKKLMMTKNTENAELLAMFYNEGIDVSKLNLIESTFDINDLINHKVDAYNGYSTNEPFYLQQKGIEFVTIDPRNYGIDFYSDCLFTSEHELSENPERVKAFREASLRGWAYALDHPEEAVDLILKKYSTLKSRDHLQFEASSIRQLIVPELIEIGHMNTERWGYIAKTYQKLGLISTSKIPDGFLYDPNPHKNSPWLYYSLAIAAILLVVIGSVTVYIYRLNRTIKQQLIHDPLTGVYNRRYLDETLPREIARAVREEYPISIVMFDLDHFKNINDTYGHATGDLILQNVSKKLNHCIRQNDFICRYGGEEFVLVMPGMPLDQAYTRMEQCRQDIQTLVTNTNRVDITITISGGIAMYDTHGKTQDEILKAADNALYISKEHGRNQITIAPIKDINE